jgi:hypothetical protein
MVVSSTDLPLGEVAAKKAPQGTDGRDGGNPDFWGDGSVCFSLDDDYDFANDGAAYGCRNIT